MSEKNASDNKLFRSDVIDKLDALKSEEDSEKQTAILETEIDQPGYPPATPDPPARPGVPMNRDHINR